jgi:hypothetical protein
LSSPRKTASTETPLSYVDALLQQRHGRFAADVRASLEEAGG